MKQYKDIDLKAIQNACDLDFAHYTYGRGQCSCCYGPLDMPARYWKDEKKPKEVKSNGFIHYELDGKKVVTSDIRYILFKNAYNTGRGYVTKEDFIQDNTVVSWNLSEEQLNKVCTMLQSQLGDEYVVFKPDSTLDCIKIRTAAALKYFNEVANDKEKQDIDAIILGADFATPPKIIL